MLSRLGSAASAVGGAALSTATAVGGVALSTASTVGGAALNAASSRLYGDAVVKWYEAPGALNVGMVGCEQKGGELLTEQQPAEQPAEQEGVPPGGDDSDDEFADAQEEESAPAPAADAAPAVGRFWVFRFAVFSEDGARILEFDETHETASTKHKEIAAAGVIADLPPVPPLAADADDAAAAACGAALAACFATVFSSAEARVSEAVRSLFEPQNDDDALRGIELDDDDDGSGGLASVAKQMAGKVSQGANLTYMQIPPRFLAPESALEKTRNIAAHFDLLLEAPKSADAEAQLARMQAVVSWLFSTMTQEVFGLKPYNPILGEVYRGIVPASAGATVVLAEQVRLPLRPSVSCSSCTSCHPLLSLI